MCFGTIKLMSKGGEDGLLKCCPASSPRHRHNITQINAQQNLKKKKNFLLLHSNESVVLKIRFSPVKI